jgi:lysine-specific demethylase 8
VIAGDAVRRLSYAGPTLTSVDQIDAAELEREGGFRSHTRPLLVRGAIKQWPAYSRWTFDRLARLRGAEGGEVVTSFQNGLVEQGRTRQPVLQAIKPYLEDLARQPVPDVSETGLLPSSLRRASAGGGPLTLDWDFMRTFEPRRVYLAQWNILQQFPELRADFDIRTLWPGWRWTWEYTFIGPALTVTGLHYDFPSNWFCMVAGTKEFLLFPEEQTPYLCRSRKYDWGATLSDIDITRLHEQPRESATFSRARGWYARVESGDALFVPARTWHGVVSLAPSISLAVFGLTAREIIAGGIPSETRSLLHKLHLYRWGNCTCHAAPHASGASS